MAKLWLLVFVIVTLLEITFSGSTDSLDFPLSKSLGYLLGTQFSSDLADLRLTRRYRGLYNEMLKLSQESVEKLDEEQQKNEKMKLKKRGITERRRRPSDSPFGRRRARSEALRRSKLANQGLRSHEIHSHTRNTRTTKYLPLIL